MKLTVQEIIDNYLHGNSKTTIKILRFMEEQKRPLRINEVSRAIESNSRQLTHYALKGLCEKGYVKKHSLTIKGKKFEGYYSLSNLVEV